MKKTALTLALESVGIARGARLFTKTLTVAVLISHLLFITCFSCAICLCLLLALPPAPSKIHAVELPLRLVQCIHGENVPCPDRFVKWILTTAVLIVFMVYLPFTCLLIYKLWWYTNWFNYKPKKRKFFASLSQKSITQPKSPSNGSTLLLPPTDKKTLFVGLDGTLIFRTSNPAPDRNGLRVLEMVGLEGDKNLYVIQRQGVDEFLRKAVSSGFEVVIFTSATRSFARTVINWLDPDGKFISHRLYINSCRETSQGIIVKDFSVIGRRLDRSVILDDSMRGSKVCVQQVENIIEVAPFEGDSEDVELRKLLRFFELHGKYNDLRDAVRHYLCASDREESH